MKRAGSALSRTAEEGTAITLSARADPDLGRRSRPAMQGWTPRRPRCTTTPPQTPQSSPHPQFSACLLESLPTPQTPTRALSCGISALSARASVQDLYSPHTTRGGTFFEIQRVWSTTKYRTDHSLTRKKLHRKARPPRGLVVPPPRQKQPRAGSQSSKFPAEEGEEEGQRRPRAPTPGLQLQKEESENFSRFMAPSSFLLSN